MGALHAGHFSLIDTAKSQCEFVVVSIFVNPTQFGPSEDFSRYPRMPEKDLEGCRAHGADVVFMPDVQEMYLRTPLTTVSVTKLADALCGASRPGHFDGVCTVCSKLFNIILPDKAFFGEKDRQQLTIIRRMAGDLDFPLQIVGCPTVRETDGLAMSSRNAYLGPSERGQAAALYESLCAAKDMIHSKSSSSKEIIAAMQSILTRKATAGQVDYIQIVDPQDLSDVETITGPVVVAMAVRFGSTRLIDNILVDAAAAGR